MYQNKDGWSTDNPENSAKGVRKPNKWNTNDEKAEIEMFLGDRMFT